MGPGERFENLAYTYLNNTYGNYVKFSHEGGADSTVPDIVAKTNQGKKFNIEVKSPAAQSSQFVVKVKNKQFRLSKRDKGKRLKKGSPLYKLEQFILKEMSKNITYYTQPTARQVRFKNYQVRAYNWVEDYYGSNNKFFITNNKYDHHNNILGNFYIFPIDHFHDYFNIRINSRYKKSGSRHAGINFNNNLMLRVKNKLYNMGFNVKLTKNSNRVYINFINRKPTKNMHLTLTGLHEKLFINKSPNKKLQYELKKTSNTANLTVIFQIRLKPYVKKALIRADKRRFIQYIQ